MPIYEYRCENDHTIEVMQSINDGPLAECTECGAPVERVFSPVAIHFKGSGFHNTDYGTRQRNKEKAKSSSEGSGKSDKSGSAKSDTKKESSKKSSKGKGSSS